MDENVAYSNVHREDIFIELLPVCEIIIIKALKMSRDRRGRCNIRRETVPESGSRNRESLITFRFVT